MQFNKARGLVLTGLLLPAMASAATLNLLANWNLVGNSDTAAIDVASRFNDPAKIVTVWKWNKASGSGKWAFYAPSMTSTELTNYATSKGYEVLTSIAPKEGFWVNAVASTVIAGDPMSAPPTPGSTAATLVATDLAEGWNLIASADNKNPSQINTNLSAGLAAFGKVLVTAWGWDVATSSWKFYAPALEAQGAETLSSYIGSKAYRSFAVAPAATDGFWVNVAPGGTTGTGLSPLYAAKDFVSTLRSNAMALDAADLSLQTELQAVSNDLKTRMVPVVDSNLDTLNLAWLAVQFWNDVVKNPNVPFVSNKTFYDNSNPYWQPVIGSCEFYMDTNYAVFASSKDEAKYIACRTEASQMNFHYIYPTDVDGQMKNCTAVGELCGTAWTTRVRLNPDQTDADKFTLYTQTRESKELALAFGYSFWDSALGKTISGLSSCPSGQSCYVSVSAKTFSNTNFGAAFPGNASALTATRDTNNQINSVSLTGELSPGFNMTHNPISGYDPVTMQWFYKPNHVAIVLGDKHNVALSPEFDS